MVRLLRGYYSPGILAPGSKVPFCRVSTVPFRTLIILEDCVDGGRSEANRRIMDGQMRAARRGIPFHSRRSEVGPIRGPI